MLGFDPPPRSVPGADRLVCPPADTAVEDLHDLLAPRTRDGATVVGLYPAWRADPWARHLELIRSVLERPALVPVPLDMPPLAGSILAGLLACVGRDRAPAPTIAAVQPVGATLRIMALLGNVGRGSHLTVSRGTKLRSFLPGTSYLAVLEGDGTRLASLRGDDLELPLEPRSDARVVVAPHVRGEVERVRRALSAAGWHERTTRGGPSTLGPDWWGTDRLVEIVAHPATDADLLPRLAELPDGAVCPWCRRRTPDLPCVYCGSRRRAEVVT